MVQLLSLAVVRVASRDVLACGSAHNDGTITLCDGFTTLFGPRSSFLSDHPGTDRLLEYDWLGFDMRWDSGTVQHRAADASLVFDEEIRDLESFSYHHRCWKAWEHSVQPFDCSPEMQLLARFGVR